EKPILRPGVVDDRLLAGVRSDLLDSSAASPMVVANQENMACLRTRRDRVYGCLLPDLVEVGSTGFGETFFDTARLLGPAIADLDETTADACWTDWLHFAFEGALPVDEPVVEPMDTASDIADTTMDTSPDDGGSDVTEVVSTDDGGDDGYACRTRGRSTTTPSPLWLLGVALGW